MQKKMGNNRDIVRKKTLIREDDMKKNLLWRRFYIGTCNRGKPGNGHVTSRSESDAASGLPVMDRIWNDGGERGVENPAANKEIYDLSPPPGD